MLAYILAITVAIGSFSFYMAAFFVPEMHRRQDFFWSGLGLFYAVVLWFCAGRLTGAVLLGQLVSVVLLGGLGWHTLALRRDLTPELVQTPVTWDDIQKLSQDLQRLVRQYGRLDDIANFGRATWGAITQIVTNWRDRAAAIPAADTPAEVPPLKRSPAYEFETAPGDGQAVPTEFATVASRQRPTQQPVASPESSATKELAEDAETAIAETTTAPSDDAEAATPRIEPAAPEATAAPRDVTDEATTASPSAAPSAAPESPTTPPRQTAAAAVPPRPAPSSQFSDQRSPELARQTNPVTGIMNWVGNLIGAGRKPKPERGVIEIPPRPPSIPKDPNATRPKSETSTPASRPSRSTKSPRAVIDIPPRPPSIPRSPAAPSEVPAPDSALSDQSTDEADTNWVDVGDVSPAVTDRPTKPPASDTDPDVTEPMPAAAVDAANWPEAETNWSVTKDETTTRRDDLPSTPGPTAARNDDTNWPDDEDTNWPA